MRASVVVPGVSEGVLPPDAEPVTAQEALHHLAKMVGTCTCRRTFRMHTCTSTYRIQCTYICAHPCIHILYSVHVQFNSLHCVHAVMCGSIYSKVVVSRLIN